MVFLWLVTIDWLVYLYVGCICGTLNLYSFKLYQSIYWPFFITAVPLSSDNDFCTAKHLYQAIDYKIQQACLILQIHHHHPEWRTTVAILLGFWSMPWQWLNSKLGRSWRFQNMTGKPFLASLKKVLSVHFYRWHRGSFCKLRFFPTKNQRFCYTGESGSMAIAIATPPSSVAFSVSGLW